MRLQPIRHGVERLSREQDIEDQRRDCAAAGNVRSAAESTLGHVGLEEMGKIEAIDDVTNQGQKTDGLRAMREFGYIHEVYRPCVSARKGTLLPQYVSRIKWVSGRPRVARKTYEWDIDVNR